MHGSELKSGMWGSGASFHGGGRACKSALAWSYLERDSAPNDDLQGYVTSRDSGWGGRQKPRLGAKWAS